MSWLWLAPAVTALVGIVVLAVAVSRAAEEAAILRREAHQLAQLRPALVEIGIAGRALGASMEDRLRA